MMYWVRAIPGGVRLERNEVLIVAQAFDGDLRLVVSVFARVIQCAVVGKSKDCPLGHKHQVAASWSWWGSPQTWVLCVR